MARITLAEDAAAVDRTTERQTKGGQYYEESKSRRRLAGQWACQLCASVSKQVGGRKKPRTRPSTAAICPATTTAAGPMHALVKTNSRRFAPPQAPTDRLQSSVFRRRHRSASYSDNCSSRANQSSVPWPTDVSYSHIRHISTSQCTVVADRRSTPGAPDGCGPRWKQWAKRSALRASGSGRRRSGRQQSRTPDQ
uniref:Uncharacterized protein n=1 Tax=Plectus sambesii TaxID=2011161 RepID=A0A914W8Z1_9BILA